MVQEDNCISGLFKRGHSDHVEWVRPRTAAVCRTLKHHSKWKIPTSLELFTLKCCLASRIGAPLTTFANAIRLAEFSKADHRACLQENVSANHCHISRRSVLIPLASSHALCNDSPFSQKDVVLQIVPPAICTVAPFLKRLKRPPKRIP